MGQSEQTGEGGKAAHAADEPQRAD
jgi:hypothetical protein